MNKWLRLLRCFVIRSCWLYACHGTPVYPPADLCVYTLYFPLFRQATNVSLDCGSVLYTLHIRTGWLSGRLLRLYRKIAGSRYRTGWHLTDVLVINACRNICSASYTETARKVLGLAIAEYVLHGPIGVGAARAWSVLRDVIVARRSTFFVSLRGWSVQLVRYHSFCRATLCWRGIRCRRVSVCPSVRHTPVLYQNG